MRKETLNIEFSGEVELELYDRFDQKVKELRIPKTETREAVINSQGQVFEVEAYKLKGSSTSE